MPEEMWDRVYAVNLKAPFVSSQAVARILVERKLPGKFVFLSSISAWVGGSYQVHYTPTKAGVSSLMKSLAVFLGPYGINCNAVLPGVRSQRFMTRAGLHRFGTKMCRCSTKYDKVQ